MSTSLRLKGDLRVEVVVQEDDIACRCEVDAQTSSARGNQEYLKVTSLIVEHADADVSASPRSATIETRVTERTVVRVCPLQSQQILDQVKEIGETGKDQYLLFLLSFKLATI